MCALYVCIVWFNRKKCGECGPDYHMNWGEVRSFFYVTFHQASHACLDAHPGNQKGQLNSSAGSIRRVAPFIKC